jgi:hypothetical protein
MNDLKAPTALPDAHATQRPKTPSEALLEAYRPYQRAKKDLPYNPDKVQAYGMAFCVAFKTNKTFICEFLKIKEEEFEYSLHHRLMPALEKHGA